MPRLADDFRAFWRHRQWRWSRAPRDQSWRGGRGAVEFDRGRCAIELSS